MAEVKTEISCIINDVKAGKSYTKPVEKAVLANRKIKDKVPGNIFGLIGYELEIRGGSDSAGFAMRPEIDTTQRKKIFVQNSVGVNVKRKGMFRRKTVRGNTISADTAQVNLAITKYGTKKVAELLGIEEKPKEEAKAEEKPKEEAKAEEKPAEKKEE